MEAIIISNQNQKNYLLIVLVSFRLDGWWWWCKLYNMFHWFKIWRKKNKMFKLFRYLFRKSLLIVTISDIFLNKQNNCNRIHDWFETMLSTNKLKFLCCLFGLFIASSLEKNQFFMFLKTKSQNEHFNQKFKYCVIWFYLFICLMCLNI